MSAREFKRSEWLGTVLAINGGSGSAPATDWDNFANNILPTMANTKAKYDLGLHYVAGPPEKPMRSWRNIFAEKLWVDIIEPLNQARKGSATLDHTVFVDSHFAPTAVGGTAAWNLGKEYATGQWFQKGYISLVYANDLIPLSPVNATSTNELVKVPHIEIFGHLVADDTSKSSTADPAEGDIASYDLGHKYAYWRKAFSGQYWIRRIEDANDYPNDSQTAAAILYADKDRNLRYWDGSDSHTLSTGASTSFNPAESPDILPDKNYNDASTPRVLGSSQKIWRRIYTAALQGVVYSPPGKDQYEEIISHADLVTDRPTNRDLGKVGHEWNLLYAEIAMVNDIKSKDSASKAKGDTDGTSTTSDNLHVQFDSNLVPGVSIPTSTLGQVGKYSLGYTDAYWQHVFGGKFWFATTTDNTVNMKTGYAILYWDGTSFKYKDGNSATPKSFGGGVDLTNVTTNIIPRKTTTTATTLLNLGASEQGGRTGDKHWGTLYIHAIRNEETTSQIQWHGHILPTPGSTTAAPGAYDLGGPNNYWNNLYVVKAKVDDLDAVITTNLRWTPDDSTKNTLPRKTNPNLHISVAGNLVPAATTAEALARDTSHSLGYIDAFWKHIFAKQYWFKDTPASQVGTSTSVGAIIFFDGTSFKKKIGTTVSDFATSWTAVPSDIIPDNDWNDSNARKIGSTNKVWKELYLSNLRAKKDVTITSGAVANNIINVYSHLVPHIANHVQLGTSALPFEVFANLLKVSGASNFSSATNLFSSIQVQNKIIIASTSGDSLQANRPIDAQGGVRMGTRLVTDWSEVGGGGSTPTIPTRRAAVPVQYSVGVRNPSGSEFDNWFGSASGSIGIIVATSRTSTPTPSNVRMYAKSPSGRWLQVTNTTGEPSVFVGSGTNPNTNTSNKTIYVIGGSPSNVQIQNNDSKVATDGRLALLSGNNYTYLATYSAERDFTYYTQVSRNDSNPSRVTTAAGNLGGIPTAQLPSAPTGTLLDQYFGTDNGSLGFDSNLGLLYFKAAGRWYSNVFEVSPTASSNWRGRTDLVPLIQNLNLGSRGIPWGKVYTKELYINGNLFNPSTSGGGSNTPTYTSVSSQPNAPSQSNSLTLFNQGGVLKYIKQGETTAVTIGGTSGGGSNTPTYTALTTVPTAPTPSKAMKLFNNNGTLSVIKQGDTTPVSLEGAGTFSGGQINDSIFPRDDDSFNLGSSTKAWNTLYIDNILPRQNQSGNARKIDFGQSALDLIDFNGRIHSNIVPSANNTWNLGGSSNLQWNILYVKSISLNGAPAISTFPSGGSVGNDITFTPSTPDRPTATNGITLFNRAGVLSVRKQGSPEYVSLEAAGGISNTPTFTNAVPAHPTGTDVVLFNKAGVLYARKKTGIADALLETDTNNLPNLLPDNSNKNLGADNNEHRWNNLYVTNAFINDDITVTDTVRSRHTVLSGNLTVSGSINFGGEVRNDWPTGTSTPITPSTPAGQTRIYAIQSEHLGTSALASVLDPVFGKTRGAIGVATITATFPARPTTSSVLLWIRLSRYWIGLPPSSVINPPRSTTSSTGVYTTKKYIGYDRIGNSDDASINTIRNNVALSGALHGRIWVHEESDDARDGELAVLEVDDDNNGVLHTRNLDLSSNAQRSADPIDSTTRVGSLDRIPNTTFNLTSDITHSGCNSAFGEDNGAIGFNIGSDALLIKVGGFWYRWDL